MDSFVGFYSRVVQYLSAVCFFDIYHRIVLYFIRFYVSIRKDIRGVCVCVNHIRVFVVY